MTNIHLHPRRRRASSTLVLRPLVASLALAISSGAACIESASSGAALLEGPALRPVHQHTALAPSATLAITHVITTCDDAPVQPTCDGIDDGTLRKAYGCALNNDTIDLTQLACSKITLSAPLTSGPVTLTLVGPGQDKLTIDGAGKFRVLVHNGLANNGLYVNGLTITNGRYDNPNYYGGGGGCIYSSGNVTVKNSVVSSCYAAASLTAATGGAIFAKGRAILDRSSVTGSTANGGDSGSAAGGGIYAGLVGLTRSTVSGNTSKAASLALAGGIFAAALYSYYSTVSGNAADGIGGIFANTAYIVDSTISGNHVEYGAVGGVYAHSAQIYDSTIAGNSSASNTAAGLAAGLYVRYAASSTVRNTIIAHNTAGGVELDAGTTGGSALPGNNNLIMAPQAGTTLPADTISADPKLGPLQDNGGPTQTRALVPGSPAIDKGSPTPLSIDQRGFPRTVGSKPDIGAVEFDPDHIFANGFNL